jgi:hypothetical protein
MFVCDLVCRVASSSTITYHFNVIMNLHFKPSCVGFKSCIICCCLVNGDNDACVNVKTYCSVYRELVFQAMAYEAELDFMPFLISNI